MSLGWFPKYAAISAASSGANSLVAAVTGKKLRVLAFNLSFSGSVNAKFTSAANDITGLFYGAAAAQAVGPFSEAGLFETAAGEALGVNLSAATAVGGYLVYAEV
jgi:hypothetical protein